MRVKWTGMMFGCVMACFFFISGVSQLDEDGLTVRTWLGLILLCMVFGAVFAWLYVVINRFLHKHDYSLHDDEDFEE